MSHTFALRAHMLKDALRVKRPRGIAMLLALTVMSALQPEDVKPDCAGNTLEINACVAEQFDRSEMRLKEYKQAAISRYSAGEAGEDSVRLGIEASNSAFEAYRSIECSTVEENWKTGTIRTVMNLQCLIDLTDARTLTIWRNWLHYMDSTPPIRPEPKPTK